MGPFRGPHIPHINNDISKEWKYRLVLELNSDLILEIFVSFLDLMAAQEEKWGRAGPHNSPDGENESDRRTSEKGGRIPLFS